MASRTTKSSERVAIADWLSALKSAGTGNGAVADVVPPGWITRVEFERIAGCSKTQATAKLTRLVTTGHAERRTFRIAQGNRVTPVPHYRLK